ncbi:MAG: hypothetical protein Q7T97_02525 [Burkholderiaceae bacterium]|nr:hypothetical protein [Burkholderiaceae bacterium]
MSKLSNEDLAAISAGDMSRVSMAGLKLLAAPAAPSVDPTEGMSFLDNALAATGKGMTSVARAVGVPSSALESIGLPGTKEDADRLDAPLMKTAGGKIGNVAGMAVMAVPTALIPGANTYAGATAIGAGTGAALTEGGLVDRAKGALFGGIGGAAGKGIGNALAWGVPKIVNGMAGSRATAQVANAQRDAAAVAAKDAGYVLPPADVNPSVLNEALNGLSGKIKTAQVASARNQGVTNTMAKKAIGVAEDAPLNGDALKAIRSQAGQAYDAVANAGTIKPGQAYSDALDKITAPYVRAAQGFPNAKPSPIIAEIESLKTPEFDAASAVAMIKKLRGDADSAYASGSRDAGKALKDGAAALEDALDTHLLQVGAPADLLKNFRDARQLIAKTYTVEKALNSETGDVSAQTLAKLLQKGKPLSGDLKTIAKVGSSFPKATQSLKESPKAFSPLDYMAGMIGTGSTGPLGAAAIAARPAVRSMMLSKAYQNALGSPQNYAPGLLEQSLPLLQSDAMRRTLPGVTGLLSANFSQ